MRIGSRCAVIRESGRGASVGKDQPHGLILLGAFSPERGLEGGRFYKRRNFAQNHLGNEQNAPDTMDRKQRTCAPESCTSSQRLKACKGQLVSGASHSPNRAKASDRKS